MAMTLRLDDDHERRLRQVAADENRPMHAVIVTAIDEYLERRNAQRFETLADEIIERHAALIDRLAQ
jgi:predicted transcriptional regulator